MDIKKVVADTIKESEQKKQEQQKQKVKAVVQKILTQIENVKDNKNDYKLKISELDKKLKVYENDLEDLKNGRLDKIEERQEKDEEHNKYTIVIVKRIIKEYIPMQPWRSPWLVEIRQPEWTYIPAGTCTGGSGNMILTNLPTSATTVTCGSYGTGKTTSSQGLTVYDSNSDFVATGVTFQNFTQGTYNVNNKIINL